MATGTQSGFPFNNFVKWIAFAFHGPDHWYRFLFGRDGRKGNNTPMFPVYVIIQLVVHSFDKLLAVGLSKGFVQEHSIGI